MKIEYNYSLLQHNTFGIDQRCKRFISVESIDDAIQLHEYLDSNEPLLIIGKGSNLLLTQDFDGTVIRCDIRGIKVVSNNSDSSIIGCGAGEVVDDVIAWSIENGLHGMENLSLIPGDVGASAVQNIGAYGVEIKDVLHSVKAVEISTGTVMTFQKDELEYAYRDSRFKHDLKGRYLIIEVSYLLYSSFTAQTSYGNISSYLLEKGIEHPNALQLREAIIDIRNAKLPRPEETGNAGSFFMNPIVPRNKYNELASIYPGMPHYTIDEDKEKIPAGWMIDQCGWKGKSLGRAGVHDRQALVLVNKGGATGAEVVTLYKQIQKDVKERFGIDIHPEVNVI